MELRDNSDRPLEFLTENFETAVTHFSKCFITEVNVQKLDGHASGTVVDYWNPRLLKLFPRNNYIMESKQHDCDSLQHVVSIIRTSTPRHPDGTSKRPVMLDRPLLVPLVWGTISSRFAGERFNSGTWCSTFNIGLAVLPGNTVFPLKCNMLLHCLLPRECTQGHFNDTLVSHNMSRITKTFGRIALCWVSM